MALCLAGLEARLIKLRKKEEELLQHQKNGTIPKVIFGGRKHFMDRLKGKLSKEEWKSLRSNTLYSRGERSKKGNLNMRIVWNEKGHFFQLEVANPLHSTKSVAGRITFKLHVPEKRFNEVAQLTTPQETFIKNEKGKIKTSIFKVAFKEHRYL
ncbi:MAG TPA: hypothetical protein VNM45_03655 [Bacillus sp. (in: firmicutes)]|nr:hypothetical protein [Bacillus sp. (in: firmicutes)]